MTKKLTASVSIIFLEVYETFSGNMTKNQKVMKLISFCHQRNCMTLLISVLEEQRIQFKDEFPELIENQEKSAQIEAIAQALDEDNEIGFLDLLDEAETHNLTFSESTTRITEAMTDVGKDMNFATIEMQDLVNGSKKSSRIEAKRVFTRTAERIEVFAKKIELELPLFSHSLHGSVTALQRSEIFLDDFPENRLEKIDDVPDALDILEEGIALAQLPLVNLKDSVLSLPRVTKEIHRAKRRAALAVDQIVQELSNTQLLIDEVRQRFMSLRNNG